MTITGEMSTAPPLLRVRGIGKRYGDRVALQDASFDLWPGEVLAVVGESGSGKSTLLNAVARLLAHRMVVMQRGHVVESGLTDQLLDDPQHPYTQLLVSSVLQP